METERGCIFSNLIFFIPNGIPIPNSRFSLVLSPFPPAPIPVLLVLSHQIASDM